MKITRHALPGYLLVFNLILIIIITTAYKANAQSKISLTATLPSSVHTCGNAQSFTINVENKSTTDTIKSGKLTVKMPAGMRYVAGSVSGSGASQYNITNQNQPVFSLSDIKPRDSIKLSFRATADCDIITFINNGGSVKNLMRLDYAGPGSDSAYSSTYTIASPSVSITGITNQTYKGVLTDTFSRFITITNTAPGSLKNFQFYIIKAPGVKVDSIKGKIFTVSGDTLKINFDGKDFVKAGDKDSLLEQNEKIVLREYNTILSCSGLNTKYTASWGCYGKSCQAYNTSSSVVINQLTPNLSFTPKGFQGTCYDPAIANSQSLTIKNNGTGPAKNIVLAIFQTLNYQAGFYNNLYSRIDENSFKVQYGSGTPVSIKTDSTSANSNYSCFSASAPKGRAWITIPAIKAGETVIVTWDVYSCCLSQGYLNGWGFQGKYYDQCNSNTYNVTLSNGMQYLRQHVGNHSASTIDLIVGDTITYSLLNSYNSNLFLPGVGNHYIQYEFTPPKGAIIKPGSIFLANSTNTIFWKPDSVYSSGGVVRATFGFPPPTGFSFNGSRIEMRVYADTAGSGVKCGNIKSMGMKLKYKPRASCNCNPDILSTNYYFSFNCINPTKVGLLNESFKIHRTSYGLPDNNDDGLADNTGSLDFSKIKRDRAMYGDTVTAFFSGKVLTDSTYTNWKYAFADLKFTDDYLQHLDISITIKDSGTNTRYTCTNVPYYKSGKTFKYFFGTDTLIKQLCALPSGFVYEKGDSIWITIRYKVNVNNSSTVYVGVSDNFYFSNKQIPGGITDYYYVNNFPGSFTAVGYYFTNCCMNTYTAYGCKDIVFSQNEYLSIGNCCANYNGGNMFPYEYRNWARIKTTKVLAPPGYKFKSANYIFYRTAGTGRTQTHSDIISPYQEINDTLFFNIDSLFTQTAKFPLPDDGYTGRLDVTFSPGCSVQPDTLMNIRYLTEHTVSDFLNPANTKTSANDRVTFSKANFAIQPALGSVSATADTFSWVIYVSNLVSNADVYNAWISAQNLSNKIIIDNVVKPDGRSAKNVNGIFRLDTIIGAQTKAYRIKARMKNCVPDSVKITFGWDCKDYPADTTSVSCETSQLYLFAEPKLPGLQLKLVSAPDSVRLCDTATYEIEIKNIQTGVAYESELIVFAPPGTILLPNSSSIKYRTSTFKSIPDPDSVAPNIYRYQATKADSVIAKSGLDGVLDSSKNSYVIRFRIINNCEYTSGNYLNFKVTSYDVCSRPVNTNQLQGKSLKINGARQSYTTDIYLDGAKEINACGGNAVLKFKIVNNGPAATDSTDNFFLNLPKGFYYLPKTLQNVQSAPSDSTLGIQFFGGHTEYSWKLNKGVKAKDSIVFTIKVQADSSGLCGEFFYNSRTTSLQELTCITSGKPCFIKVENGAAGRKVEIKKPIISLSAFKASSQPGTFNTEEVLITGELKNSGAPILAGSYKTIKFYADKDKNKFLSSGDEFLGADTFTTALLKDSIYKLSKTFPVSAGKACNIIAVFDTSGSNCACSPSQFYINPVIHKNAGKDTAICSGETIQLGFDSINGYKYSWLPVSGLNDALISNPQLTITNSTSAIQKHWYYLSTDRGGCMQKDSVQITVYPLPVVNAGADKTICKNDSVTIGGSPVASGGSGTYSYTWSPEVAINNINIANPKVSPSVSTYYKVKVKDNRGCVQEDSVLVTVNTLPIVTAGADQTICEDDSVIIGGSPAATGSATPFAFSWNPATGLNNAAVANPVAKPKITTVYVLSVTDANGCSVKDTIKITVNNKPVTDAGKNKIICAGDSVVLGENPTASGGGGNYFYKWSPATGLNSDTIANPVAKPVKTTVYFVEVTDAKGCKSKDSVRIEVAPLPIVNAGNDTIICKGNSIKIGGNPTASGGSGSYTYSWSPATGLSSTSVANPFANPTSTTVYKLKVTDTKGCSEFDSIKITVKNLPVIFAGNNDTICPGDSILLQATSVGNYKYIWQPGKLVSDSTILKPKFSPAKTTNFILKAIDSFGCYSVDSVNIYVRPVTKINPPRLACVDIVKANKIKLSWVNNAAEPEFAHFNIYRKDSSANFKLISKISDPTVTSFNDSGVSNVFSKSFGYFITISNKCGYEGKASDTLNSIILNGIAKSDKAASLNWNKAGNNSYNYDIEYNNGSGFTSFVVTKDTFYNFSNCGLDGVFRVSVKDASNCISNSNISSKLILKDSVPPSVPEIHSATVDNWSGIRLKFFASDSADTKEYQVYRADSSGSYSLVKTILHTGAAVYTFNDNNVQAEKYTYFYKIKAKDTCGNESSFSTVHSPVLLSGAAGNYLNKLSWKTYKGFTVKNYVLERYEKSGWNPIISLKPTDSSYIDSFLACKITQFYRIKTIENGGNNAVSYSDSIALTPFDTIFPAEVNIRYATVKSAGSIELAFDKVADTDVKKYEIYASVNGGSFNLISTVSLPFSSPYIFTHSGINTQDNKYCYQVFAEDSCAGNRSKTSETHCAVQLEGTAFNLSSQLKWSTYKGFNVKNYVVERFEKNNWNPVISLKPSDSSFLDTALACNITRIYRIKATENGGDNAVSYSDTIALTPWDTIKPVPPVINYITALNNKTIYINWNRSISKDVKKYILYRKAPGAGSFSPLVSLNNDSFYYDTLSSFLQGSYCYAVVAVDSCADNKSVMSAIHCSIYLTSAVNGCKQEIKLKWNAYTGWPEGVNKYNIYRNDSGGVEALLTSLNAPADTFTDNTNIDYSKTYCYRIEAVRGGSSGNASASNSVCNKTFAPQTPEILFVSKLTTSANGGQVLVKWKNQKNSRFISYHDLYYKADTATGFVLVQGKIAAGTDSFLHTGLNTQFANHQYYLVSTDSCGTKTDTSATHKTMELQMAVGQLIHDLQWSPYEGWAVKKYLVQSLLGNEWKTVDSVPGNMNKLRRFPAACNSAVFYRIMAVNNQGIYALSDSAGGQAIDSVPPDAPVLLNASIVNGNAVKIDFLGADSADMYAYVIQRAANGGSYTTAGQVLFSSPSALHNFIDSINTLKDYHCYTVISLDSCLNASPSDTFCTIQLDGKPQNLSNKLSWKPFKGYEIDSQFVQLYDSGSWKNIAGLSAAETSFIHQPLQCNVEITYRILAIEKGGSRITYSDSISLTPFDTVPPPAPLTNYSSVVNGNAIYFSWQMAVPKVKLYEVSIKTSNGNWIISDTLFKQTNYTFTGLNTLDSAYCVSVRAIDSCAENISTQSVVHCPVQLDGIELNLSNGLNWTAYKGFAGIDKYFIYRWSAGWQILDSVNNSVLTYTDTPLACNVQQYYKICVKDVSGQFLSYSDSIALTPFDTIKPGAPQFNYISVLDDHSIKLSWQWDTTKDVKYFEIWKKSSTQSAFSQFATVIYDSIFIDSNVNPQKETYSYFIIAVDSCSNLNRSVPSDTDVTMILTASTGGCKPFIALKWSAYNDLPNGVDNYIIYRSQGSGFNKIASVNASELKFTDSAVTESTNYCYKIEALDKTSGFSSFSDSLCLTPFVFPAPDSVQMVRVSVSKTGFPNGEVFIEWKMKDPADTMAIGYRVYYMDSASSSFKKIHQENDTNVTSFIHSGINTQSATNEYYVVTYSGCDVESEPAFTHKTIDLSITNKNLATELKWTKYKGFKVNNYDVYRSENNGPAKLIAIIKEPDSAFTDTNVSCLQKYTYFIEARGGINLKLSSFSDVETVTVFDTIPPSVPDVFTASVTNTDETKGNIEITFKGTEEINRKGYILYRSADGGTSYMQIANVDDTNPNIIIHNDSILNTSSKTFSYYFASVDSCGNVSAPSDTHTVISLSATAQNGINHLEWTHYKGWKTWNYRIERKTSSTNWISLGMLPQTINSFDDSLVKCFIKYEYRIVGKDNETAFFSYSNTDTATAFEHNKPQAPALKRATVNSTGITNGTVELQWKSSHAKDLAYYEVMRSDNGINWISVAKITRDSFFTDDKLNTYGQSYYYHVRSVDSCGNIGEIANDIHKTITLKTQTGNQQIDLSWNAYEGFAVQNYNVYKDGKLIAVLSGSSLAFTDTMVICKTVYKYEIKAFGTDTLNSFSLSSKDSMDAYDTKPPRPVHLITATVSHPNDEITIEWTKSTNFDAKNYSLYRRETNRGARQLVFNSNNIEITSYKDTVSPSQYPYCYEIEVSDFCNNASVASNQGCIMLLTGKAEKLSHRLSWNAYEKWNQDVAYYNIYKREDSTDWKFIANISGKETSFTDYGNNIESFVKDHCYQVEAVENNGFGAKSKSTVICLEQQPIVWLPNAFTPAFSYTLNDYFGPKGTYIAHYEMQIINRWGQVVYNTEKSEPWNGKLGGNYVPEGIYMYRLTVYSYDDKKYFYNGTVTILK